MRAKINLYNEDCLPAMQKMADNQYDLAIVDPPYGVNYGNLGKLGFGGVARSNIYKPTKWDKSIPDKKYFNQLFRISKNQIIWGINHYTNMININSGRIIWDKLLPYKNISGLELAYQSKSSGIKVYKYLWHGMLQENMKNKEIRLHPTQKPVALYKFCLRKYAKEGDKILDTHFGSLSIGIACWDYGYDLDAWEIDKDYFEAGKKRLETHKAQLQLYD